MKLLKIICVDPLPFASVLNRPGQGGRGQQLATILLNSRHESVHNFAPALRETTRLLDNVCEFLELLGCPDKKTEIKRKVLHRLAGARAKQPFLRRPVRDEDSRGASGLASLIKADEPANQNTSSQIQPGRDEQEWADAVAKTARAAQSNSEESSEPSARADWTPVGSSEDHSLAVAAMGGVALIAILMAWFWWAGAYSGEPGANSAATAPAGVGPQPVPKKPRNSGTRPAGQKVPDRSVDGAGGRKGKGVDTRDTGPTETESTTVISPLNLTFEQPAKFENAVTNPVTVRQALDALVTAFADKRPFSYRLELGCDGRFLDIKTFRGGWTTTTPLGKLLKQMLRNFNADVVFEGSTASIRCPRSEAVGDVSANAGKTNVVKTESNIDPSQNVMPRMSGIQSESHGFLYELQSCTSSGTSVRCTFFVTNQNEDRELMILESAKDREGTARDFAALSAGIPGSRVIDDSGNIAIMREARLANYGRWGGTLVGGVRTKLVVDFEGVSPAARMLSVLDLGCSETRKDTFGIQFRQVPLLH
jgi:hypothetical protein